MTKKKTTQNKNKKNPQEFIWGGEHVIQGKGTLGDNGQKFLF